MRVFLDTNIIIDFFDCRKGFYLPATHIFDMVTRGEITMVVSALSFVNAAYILRKSHPKDELYSSLRSLQAMCVISDINKSMISDCLEKMHPDFEDSMQIASALSEQVELIITRDAKHFRNSPIPTKSPIQFLDEWFA